MNKLTLTLLLLFSYILLYAQVDPEFNPLIKKYPDIQVLDIAPNGTIYLGGAISSVDSTATGGLVALDSTGRLKKEFKTTLVEQNWLVDVEAFDTTLFTIGYPEHLDLRLGIQRWDTLGNPKEFVDIYAHDIEGQNNKLIVSYSTVTNRRLIERWHNINQVDESFAYVELNSPPTAITVLSDQKILIGNNEFSDLNGTPINHIARLNEDGSLDESFIGTSGFNQEIFSIYEQQDGKYLVAGMFDSVGVFKVDGLVRLENDGTLDTAFAQNMNHEQFYSYSRKTAMELSDNKILLHGFGDDFQVKILRLHPDGTLDNSFTSPTGPLLDANFPTFTRELNGNVLISNNFLYVNDSLRPGIALMDTAGNILSHFKPVIGGSPDFDDVIIQPDNKVIISGDFFSVNHQKSHGLARINSDGTTDISFTQNVASSLHPNTRITGLGIDSLGRIYVGGDFKEGIDMIVKRFEPDGSPDNAFTLNITAISIGSISVVDQFIFEKDSILISGLFQYSNGGTSVLKTDYDGNIDFSFANMDMPSPVYQLLPFGNGYLAGSSFKISKIRRDGTFDPDFSEIDVLQTYDNRLSHLKQLSDSTFYWHGSFEGGSGPSSVNPIHIHGRNGEAINSQLHFNGDQRIYTSEKVGRDRYMFGGDQVNMQGQVQAYLSTVDLDGNLYNIPEVLPNDEVRKIALDTFSIIVAGRFNHFGDKAVTGLVRLLHFDPYELLPLSPDNLSGSFDASNITLSWSGNTDDNWSYEVYRLTDGLIDTLDVVINEPFSLTDSDVTSGHTYGYFVAAMNDFGYSMTTSDTLYFDLVPPSVPGELAAGIDENDHVLLTWTDLSDKETGYIIQKASGEGTFETLETLEPNVTSFTDVNVDHNGLYKYQVIAQGIYVNSEATVPVEVTIPPLGIDNITAQFIYPNPSDGIFKLPASLHLLRIVDMQGRSFTYQSQISKGLHFVSLDQPTNGLFLVHVLNGQKEMTLKLLINTKK